MSYIQASHSFLRVKTLIDYVDGLMIAKFRVFANYSRLQEPDFIHFTMKRRFTCATIINGENCCNVILCSKGLTNVPFRPCALTLRRIHIDRWKMRTTCRNEGSERALKPALSLLFELLHINDVLYAWFRCYCAIFFAKSTGFYKIMMETRKRTMIY